MRTHFGKAWRHAAIGLVALVVPHLSTAGEPISTAETLLFETDHLQDIGRPLSLYYDFSKSGSAEAGYRDDVVITIQSIGADGTKSVSTRYLSGERQRNFPPVAQARGNPVLMYFLERDIREMQRLTGGNWHYFQKRIRLALADRAQVRAVRFRHGHEELRGQEIRITPYADDPKRFRYEKLADKYYVFVLSEEIPGGVYQVRAVVPAGKDAAGSGTVLEETLTFAGTGAR